MRIADVALAFLLANNLLFVHLLGVNELFSGSKSKQIRFQSLSMGLLLVVASFLLWAVDFFLLQPGHLEVLRTLVYVFVLWGLSEIYGLAASLLMPEGNFPSPRDVLLNSMLLGGCLLVVQSSHDFFELIAAGVAATVGYAVSLVLFHAVNSRMTREKIPAVIQGLPLQLFTCGLVAMIFGGLSFSFAGFGR